MIQHSEALRGTNLNSVWLEGTVVAEPIGAPAVSGTPVIRFQIQDHRPQDSGPPSIFEIEASYPAMGSHRYRLEPGQQVRIIGRLKQDKHQVRVIGEMVEAIGS